jgi:hypothetical protein
MRSGLERPPRADSLPTRIGAIEKANAELRKEAKGLK